MDIAAKCGLLVKGENGKWVPGPYADERRVYLIGDAKTADLFEKCVFNLKNNTEFSADNEKFEQLDTL